MRNDPPASRLHIAATTVLSLGMLALGGCVYQLGSSLPSHLKTLYLPTFVNKCGEPQVETTMTQAALQEFQKDGTLRVVPSANEADLIVEVTLSSFKLEPLRYEKDQPKTTKEYRLRIGADVVVRQTKAKEMLSKRSVEGQATFIVAGDLTTSKQNATPTAASDLAHKIVESVTEAW
jgi:hypothetical protein